MMHVLAGALLGLAGSGHCAAMCGPLMLIRHPASAGRNVVLHQLGRMTTYALLGALAGLTGHMFAWAGFRELLAVTIGAALLLQGVGSLLHCVLPGSSKLAAFVTQGIAVLSRNLPRTPALRSLALGTLNGLLPCGMLYAALAAAAAMGDAMSAVEFISAFAIGTLPVFAVLAVATRTFLPRDSPAIRRMAPLALAAVGLLLVVRGITITTASIAHLGMHH
jgi:sulfite exporter TauE/SafE